MECTTNFLINLQEFHNIRKNGKPCRRGIRKDKLEFIFRRIQPCGVGYLLNDQKVTEESLGENTIGLQRQSRLVLYVIFLQNLLRRAHSWTLLV